MKAPVLDVASDQLAQSIVIRPPLSHISFPASLVVHAVLVALLAMVGLNRPIVVRQVRTIDVQIITQLEYEDAFQVPPEVVFTPLAAPITKVDQDTVPPAPSDGMTAATELFSNRVLSDPRNRQVRETLPALDGTERIIQLCNIEGLEQLRLAKPGPLPDSISPAAFAPTILQGLTLKGAAAAYRAARKWYEFRFNCTVQPDFSGVADYRFATGVAIPEDQWEAHDLIAEDEAE